MYCRSGEFLKAAVVKDGLVLRSQLLEEEPEFGDGLHEAFRHDDEPVVQALLNRAPFDLDSESSFRKNIF